MMEKLKTFREMRTTTEVYPTNLDVFQADKEAINSWFDNRLVVDNNNFVGYFQRVLIRDYRRYRELLRTQPDISKFDWLVQQYTESQTYEKGVGATATSGENSSNTTTANTSHDNVAVSKNGSETSNFNGVGSRDESITGENSRMTVNSGTDTTSHVGSEERTGETTTQASGSDSVASEDHTNQKVLTRENPMSISYNGGVSIDRANGNTGALNWEYPSTQGETDTRGNSENQTSYGRKDETSTEDNVSQTATDSVVHGLTVNEESDQSESKQESTSETHSNSVVRSDGEESETSHSGSGSTSNTAQNSSSTNESKQRLTQHINTGRSVDTATLLTQAQAYIMNSSAFEWLYKQLDVCFMGVYHDDDECFI